MLRKYRTFLIWFVLIGIFVGFYSVKRHKHIRTQAYSNFQKDLDSGKVTSVRIDGNKIIVDLDNKAKAYSTIGVVDEKLMGQLEDWNVEIAWGPEKDMLLEWISFLVPILIFLAVLVFFLKRSGGNNQRMLQLTQSKARLIDSANQITFSDVGGCKEAKLILQDLVDFLKDPQKWTSAGARLPRGILLEGVPGSGKTLLARAVAGETKAKFYAVSGSEFVELFVGVGAARIRDMFDTARQNAPAVIFIDELDAVGRARGSGSTGLSNDEKEQTLNQLLVCMDGFDKNDRVVVIGATNRADILDRALIRPGRFEAILTIPNLDKDSREQVIKIHTRNKSLAQSVSIDELTDKTEGFNGAQIESMCNHAALLAVRRLVGQDSAKKVEIEKQDFLEAIKIVSTRPSLLSGIDAILIESTSQLTKPHSKTLVKISLEGGSVLTGEVMWANAAFIKIKQGENAPEIAIAKNQINKLEPAA